MIGLIDLLTRNCAIEDAGRDGFFDLHPAYYSPGFLVPYVARARARNLRLTDLKMPDEMIGYARAIRIEEALGAQDSYPYERKNAGLNYSPLVVMDAPNQVDPATSCINGCLRTLFQEPSLSDFVEELSDLVGDLHDNVWSHGKNTGISMAQRWPKQRGYGARRRQEPEYCFELAVADCGYGFLRELGRAGIAQRQGIDTDRAAIEWCIQSGNTSKPSPSDEWAQRLPEDIMGNRVPGAVLHGDDWNHHLGLGLAKLVTLVTNYGGELWLATGRAMLTIDLQGRHTYSENSISWSGVALACRFETDRVRQRRRPATGKDVVDSLLEDIIRGAS